MITTHAVEYIANKLKAQTNNEASGSSEWGFDTDSNEGIKQGLFIILYNDKKYKEGASENTDRDGIKPLAVSTRIPFGCINQVKGTGNKNTLEIKIDNVPYTNTKSVVIAGDADANGDYPKANRFALVDGKTVSTPEGIIDGDGTEVDRYILDKNDDFKVLFEGNIQNPQTIEPDNSFALTNISISFSSNS